MKLPGPTAARALRRARQAYVEGAEAIVWGGRRGPASTLPASVRLTPSSRKPEEPKAPKKAAPETITREGLEKDDDLLVDAATGDLAPPPAGTTSTGAPEVD